MALTKTNSTDFDTLLVASNETAHSTVHVDLLEDGSGTVHSIAFVNTGGSADPVYLKLFDSQSVTLGTSDPIFSYKMMNAEFTHIHCRTGISFSTACTLNVNENPATSHVTSNHIAVSYSIMGS